MAIVSVVHNIHPTHRVALQKHCIYKRGWSPFSQWMHICLLRRSTVCAESNPHFPQQFWRRDTVSESSLSVTQRG